KVIGEDVPEFQPTPAAAMPRPDISREMVLAQPTPAGQTETLTTYLQQQLALLLRQPAERIERDRPLAAFGLDSLLAIELKTAVEEALDIDLPIASLLESPTIEELSAQIVNDLGQTAARDSQPIPAAE